MKVLFLLAQEHEAQLQPPSYRRHLTRSVSESLLTATLDKLTMCCVETPQLRLQCQDKDDGQPSYNQCKYHSVFTRVFASWLAL